MTSARFEQAGDFRVGDTWYPFRARQEFSVEPAGFVWDAHIAMSRLMPVLVRDSYVGGAGSMRGEVLAVYPLVNQSNRPELDAGALQRFLAESVWFPSALLPRQNLTWEPIDDRRARAALTDRHTTVSLEFRFNDAGDVTEIFAPDRFAENHGRYEPKPWVVTCSEYELHAGMRIPVRCEVAWVEGTTPGLTGEVASPMLATTTFPSYTVIRPDLDPESRVEISPRPRNFPACGRGRLPSPAVFSRKNGTHRRGTASALSTADWGSKRPGGGVNHDSHQERAGRD